MNFKSLFGGKPAPDDEPITKARGQHYSFAHRLMPLVAHKYGANTVLLLDRPDDAPGFLQRVWQDAAEGFSGVDLVAPAGLGARVHLRNRQLAAVIALPTPLVTPEAYFIAIVCEVPMPAPADKSEASLDNYREMLAQIPVVYWTLEYGFTSDGSRRTALCQWDSAGSHLNFGTGPAPDEAAFVEKILGASSLE